MRSKVKYIIPVIIFVGWGVILFSFYYQMTSGFQRDIAKVDKQIAQLKESNQTYEDSLKSFKQAKTDNKENQYKKYLALSNKFIKLNKKLVRLMPDITDPSAEPSKEYLKTLKDIEGIATMEENPGDQGHVLPFNNKVKFVVTKDSVFGTIINKQKELEFVWQLLYKDKVIGFITGKYDSKENKFLDMNYHLNNTGNKYMSEITR